jgi:tetratricopeptide (TPR) repeat protein
LTTSLTELWQERGPAREGREWLEDLVARMPTTKPMIVSKSHPTDHADLRSAAWYALGYLSWVLGDYRRAREAFERSRAFDIEVGDERGAAVVQMALGLIAMNEGDYQEAERLTEEALPSLHTAVDQRNIAGCLGNLGLCALMRGDLERARSLFEDSLAQFRILDDAYSIALSVENLGVVALYEGDLDESTRLLKESIRRMGEIDSSGGTSLVLEPLAADAVRRGSVSRAAVLLAAAEILREESGVALDAIESILHEETLETLRKNMDESQLTAAWAEGRAMTGEQTIAYALEENLDPIDQPQTHAE